LIHESTGAASKLSVRRRAIVKSGDRTDGAVRIARPAAPRPTRVRPAAPAAADDEASVFAEGGTIPAPRASSARRRAHHPHSMRGRARLGWALAAGLVLCACGHLHATWSPSERRLCSDGACYRVGPLGAGFRLVRAEERQVGFLDEARGAVAQANATCRDDAEPAPLDALLRQMLVGYTQRHERSRTRETLDGREALHAVLDVRLDGVPRVLDLFVLKRNGCVFDLSLATPPATYAEVQPEFARFVAGFADERPPPTRPRVPRPP
jgi:hypothetical protein